MKKRIIILLFILPLFNYAQSPWTVNPTEFEFSMNITGMVKLNGMYINQAESYIGAFVNDECRGVIESSQVESGEYVYFMSIYSNSPEGESLNFRFVDNLGSTIDFPQDVLFKADKIYGNPNNPFLWMDPIEYTTTQIFDIYVSDQVGETQYDNTGHNIYIATSNSFIENLELFFNLSPGAEAYISSEQIFTGQAYDLSNVVELTILGVDGAENNWTLHVTNTTSVNSNTISKNIRVYPTLIRGNLFHVETSKPINYRIYSINGKLLQQGVLNAGIQTIVLNDIYPNNLYVFFASNQQESFSVILRKE